MAKNYAKSAGIRNARTHVSQMTRARADQIQNDAGGYVFKIDDWKMLRRFLCIGTVGGSFYVTERKLSRDNAKTIIHLVNADGKQFVDEVVKVSSEGLAPKADPCIFALAMACNAANVETRRYAYSQLSKVCRIGTHMAIFATYLNSLKDKHGWGRAMRNAVSRWFNEQEPKRLATQICKYASRSVEGEQPWTPGDFLRMAHTTPASELHSSIFRYATKGAEAFNKSEMSRMDRNENIRYIVGHEKAKKAQTAKEIVALIKEYGLTRESIPTEFLKVKAVWEALLIQGMPMTAMLRNLNNMTKNGVLAPMSPMNKIVVDALTNEENLRKARLHPINILVAKNTYDSGRGVRGDGTWTPVPQISKALDDAFYASFKFVEPTGKRILLAIDMSGSMGWGGDVVGTPNLNKSQAAAAMAMAIARIEPNHHIIGFDTVAIDNLNITGRDSLSEVMRKISPRGGTNCSIPMTWASNHKVPVDAFVILTDNDSWSGTHPFQAAEGYRKMMRMPDAKVVVVALNATNASIGDQTDNRTLDVVGFDSSTPQLISNFIADSF